MGSTHRPSVLFDASPLRYFYTGLGQFTFSLAKELASHPGDLEISFLLHKGSRKILHPFTSRFVDAGWIRRRLPAPLKPFGFRRYDLWHVTAENSPYTHVAKGTKVLLTIHGLHFLDEDTAEVAERKLKQVQALVDRSDAIATVSSFTASLVRKHLHTGEKQIRIIPHGVEDTTGRELRQPDFVPEGKFIFTVGSFFERKNFHVLLPFLARLDGYSLVIAGRNNNAYGERIQREITAAGLAGRVVLAGEVDNEDKWWYYHHCDAFVFPSVSEGFGIPVIEAMLAGKPVFCSSMGSLPEVGGDLAWYWQRFDPQEMKEFFEEKMRLFQADPSWSLRLREYARGFTWQKASEDYLSYYADLTGTF